MVYGDIFPTHLLKVVCNLLVRRLASLFYCRRNVNIKVCTDSFILISGALMCNGIRGGYIYTHIYEASSGEKERQCHIKIRPDLIISEKKGFGPKAVIN